MNVTKCLHYTFCKIDSDQTKIVHSSKHRPFWHVCNKFQTSLLLTFFFRHEHLFTPVLFGCWKQPGLLTLPTSFNFNFDFRLMARDSNRGKK